MMHFFFLSFFFLFLPLVCLVASTFLERISRIRSKNTWKYAKLWITQENRTPEYMKGLIARLSTSRSTALGHSYCSRKVQTAYAGGFLSYNMLHMSLLRCTFLSYARGFHSYAAHFSPIHWRISTLAKFLFSASIYLAEQRNS